MACLRPPSVRAAAGSPAVATTAAPIYWMGPHLTDIAAVGGAAAAGTVHYCGEHVALPPHHGLNVSVNRSNTIACS